MSVATVTSDWKTQLSAILPLFGHRNWIVVADSAYPAQSKPGIETIVSGADQLAVVRHVLDAITACAHVRANVYADNELAFVSEVDAPGIEDYRCDLATALHGASVQYIPHDQIIAKLDQSAQVFRILLIKTEMTIPYTSVFFELDCGYWSADGSSASARRSQLRIRNRTGNSDSSRKDRNPDLSCERQHERKVTAMALNRRDLLKSLGGACSALALSRYARAQAKVFEGTRQSLESYQIPEWFRDAKFGIWSHWGPQSAVEDGDWYARNMYIQGSDQYRYHCETYGHPTKVGYKDIVDNWKAAKWDPDHLMGLYKKAGAKYFFSMGVHHDNFDLWNSKYQRWNAVNMGPKKDVVGMWQKAARNHGLRFGVSEHLWISYKWFATSHGADKTGPLTGVPYDGADSQYADLYHDAGCAQFIDSLKWEDDGIPESWRKHYLDRMTDLIDKYQPDLLYTDGHLPFEEYGLKMVAHLYNVSAQLHGGATEAIYTSKLASDCVVGTCLVDHERGVSDGIAINPWQTDTCIGQWHYKRGQKYKTPKKVIDLLTDIVSKNGNLLLNFPLPNSGELDFEEMEVLEGITAWMQVNSEGIYSTRPWKIYGEGPSTATRIESGNFNEDKQGDLTAADVRFTAKGSTVYAFVMGWPEQAAVVEALGLSSPQRPGKILKVELLGYNGDLNWKQGDAALKVLIPAKKLSDIGITLKVTLA